MGEIEFFEEVTRERDGLLWLRGCTEPCLSRCGILNSGLLLLMFYLSKAFLAFEFRYVVPIY